MKATTALFLALSTALAPAATIYSVTGGHIDALAFGYVSNAEAALDGSLTQGFEPHVHNHGGAGAAIVNGSVVTDESEYEPGDITFVVPLTSTTTFNSQPVYWLPESEGDAANQGTPFAGLGIEELGASDWVGGTINLTLVSVSGPGGVVLWQDGFPDADVLFDSAGDIRSFAAGSHNHFNWGFSAPGSYQLEFAISGNHVDDGFQTASGVFNFDVVPEPSSVMLGLLGVPALFRRRR